MSFKGNFSSTTQNDFTTIDELSHESSEPHVPSTTEVNDFEGPSSSPIRSYTHPRRPLKPRLKAPLRPFSFYKRFNKTQESHVSTGRTPRQCTGMSDNTNFSESFDETEVWDQKVILSLGMLIKGLRSLRAGVKLIVSRWWWDPRLLGASDTTSLDESHWKD